MLNQALYFELNLFNFNNISISINALVLLSIFLLSFTFKDKSKLIKYLCIGSYILILLGITKVFIQNNEKVALLELSLDSFNYYLYSLFAYGFNSFVNFSIVYATLKLIVMIPFAFIFSFKRSFISFISILVLVNLLFYGLNLSYKTLSLSDLLFYLIGYLLSKFLVKIYNKNIRNVS